MNTCQCDWCGELFWSDDAEQAMCPTCVEEPDRQRAVERAVEQELSYVRERNRK